MCSTARVVHVGHMVPDAKHYTEIAYTPFEYLPWVQDIYITAKDGTKLHSWMMWPKGWSKQKRHSRPTVLFFQARSQGHLLACLPVHITQTLLL